MKTIIELCCGGIEDVKLADKYALDRIELNNALELGGITPSVGLVLEAKASTTLPIMCMIRPRGAGFNYTDQEIEQMFIDAETLLSLGVDGIVFGFLNKNNTIKLKPTKEMVDLAHHYHAQAIFHKAFDKCKDQDKALKQLITCKVDRVLTSGVDGDTVDYKGIKHLIKIANKKIEILPGGGINYYNAPILVKETKTPQLHMSCKNIFKDNGEYLAVDEKLLTKTLKALKRKY